MQNAGNLIWVDMEMTGLEPEQDVVIEIATIVTDSAKQGTGTWPCRGPIPMGLPSLFLCFSSV